ncbi:hypothetical protein [Aneurinibacillus soli]|uniref:Uncharacterized protein n=1 Tax=Aneurinibacillus soli TaxID=1500254 RepID=A0A0U5B9K0_9BACL|nr:hypothetical protein [Aneurinibacillus soli]BAU27596.1 hypothetical protein CB4_01770 [Aneurinibacillus soli]
MDKKPIRQPTGITVRRIYEPDPEAMKEGLTHFIKAPVKKDSKKEETA